MKSLHDYRGEHKAALKRYRRAMCAWMAPPYTNVSHAQMIQASRALTNAYRRRFAAEVAHREGVEVSL